MTWIAWAGMIIVLMIAVEAVLIMPDKMPWNKKKGKK